MNVAGAHFREDSLMAYPAGMPLAVARPVYGSWNVVAANDLAVMVPGSPDIFPFCQAPRLSEFCRADLPAERRPARTQVRC